MLIDRTRFNGEYVVEGSIAPTRHDLPKSVDAISLEQFAVHGIWLSALLLTLINSRCWVDALAQCNVAGK